MCQHLKVLQNFLQFLDRSGVVDISRQRALWIVVVLGGEGPRTRHRLDIISVAVVIAKCSSHTVGHLLGRIRQVESDRIAEYVVSQPHHGVSLGKRDVPVERRVAAPSQSTDIAVTVLKGVSVDVMVIIEIVGPRTRRNDPSVCLLPRPPAQTLRPAFGRRLRLELAVLHLGTNLVATNVQLPKSSRQWIIPRKESHLDTIETTEGKIETKEGNT